MSVTINWGLLQLLSLALSSSSLSSLLKRFLDLDLAMLSNLLEIEIDCEGTTDLGVFKTSDSSSSGDDWRSWKYWIKGSVKDLLILSNFSRTGDCLIRTSTDFSMFPEKGGTSATGRPDEVGVVWSCLMLLRLLLLLVVFGGDELLDNDSLDNGKICVEIPSTGDSWGFCGVFGISTRLRSASLMIVISPKMNRKIGR